MKDVVYAYIPELPDTAIRALLVLEFFERWHKRIGELTESFLAEAAGLSERAFSSAVRYLTEHPRDSAFIQEYVENEHIALNPKFFLGDTIKLKKEKRDLLAKEVQSLTFELIKRGREIHGVTSSILSSGKEGDMIVSLSRELGRGFTEEEAFLLGKCISAFGPERVLTAFYKASGRNRIRSMHAMLHRGAFGQGAKQKIQEESTYREL